MTTTARGWKRSRSRGGGEERTGIACQVAVPSEPLPLRSEQATGVFRIFQELLTNVARHARASCVEVALDRTGASMKLEVRDDGCGLVDAAVRDPASLGLLGMHERDLLMGGEAGPPRRVRTWDHGRLDDPPRAGCPA
jgi:signal transduction histidine kinase